MSVDIKTATIETKRITFDHVAKKLAEGKSPSRYQEVVYGHQAQDVFHYRPTWEPELELFDARRTAIVLNDFDDLNPGFSLVSTRIGRDFLTYLDKVVCCNINISIYCSSASNCIFYK